MIGECRIVGCEKSGRVVRGMCQMHYSRWLRHGDPDVVKFNPKTSHTRRAADFPPPTPQSTPCRIWQGPLLGNRYGRRTNGTSAHRWVWEQAYGPIPPGMVVMHRCDNPPCFRLDHLFLGTQLENIADMVAKGRSTRGAANPGAKLTEEAVRLIRSRYAGGESSKSIAGDFNIGSVHVDAVVARRRWRHVA